MLCKRHEIYISNLEHMILWAQKLCGLINFTSIKITKLCQNYSEA